MSDVTCTTAALSPTVIMTVPRLTGMKRESGAAVYGPNPGLPPQL